MLDGPTYSGIIGFTYYTAEPDGSRKEAGSRTDNHSVHFVSVAAACDDQVRVVARSKTAASQLAENTRHGLLLGIREEGINTPLERIQQYIA
jgi:hypothetical protein